MVNGRTNCTRLMTTAVSVPSSLGGRNETRADHRPEQRPAVRQKRQPAQGNNQRAGQDGECQPHGGEVAGPSLELEQCHCCGIAHRDCDHRRQRRLREGADHHVAVIGARERGTGSCRGPAAESRSARLAGGCAMMKIVGRPRTAKTSSRLGASSSKLATFRPHRDRREAWAGRLIGRCGACKAPRLTVRSPGSSGLTHRARHSMTHADHRR